ncbi:NYN domain-containing protein [Polluticoccus soli]|uniref:NYN domain-containing protein n=1 Tax=Polluticoccus soli TaxID=3034150 RepID=UPI0023E13B2B|nr:NYN domain-containing protein [Flavipsychrobacter sp. JY13-12]
MTNTNELRFAVLIDADNVPSGNLKEMMEEIAKYGIPTFKRIYADWTKPHVARWKDLLLEHGITPIQQYSYTTGKNATDSAMIIDAMDILYSGRVDGFCIISSDSDFTRLALRLREAGMKVIGMGQKKTPAPFIAACDKFVYIEILKRRSEKPQQDLVVVGTAQPKRKTEQPHREEAEEADIIRKVDQVVIDLISSTIVDVAGEDGWAYLGDVGNLLAKKQPDFDARNYGFKKLVLLIKSIDAFEIDERASDKGSRNLRHVYIRLKPAPAKPKPRRGGRKKKEEQ